MRPRPRADLVVGTRPEAIKLAPLALGAAAAGLAVRIVLTGQHPGLARHALAHFGLAADLMLAPALTGTLGADERALEAALTDALRRDPPDLVVVQGDTSSALAGARAARALGRPLAHVEAGLRSHDLALPFPEERNRVEIDALADLLFAPTPEAAANLTAERVAGTVLVTGNTGIDALLAMRGRVALPAGDGRPLVLVTCHRRESLGGGLAGICAAAARIAARGDTRVLLALHCNPAVRAEVTGALAGSAVELVEPLAYPDMVRTMAAARLILTDSGGVQEEAATLAVPCLVARDVTERPEGVASGNLRLVGTDPLVIAAEAARLLDDAHAHAAMCGTTRPFGDGRAAERILAACREALHRAQPARVRTPA